VGSVVQLSSGHLAVVYRLHRAAEQVGSPVLIVVTNPEGQLLEEPGTLDLAAHPNLQIARAVDPAEHDINPLDYFAVPERTPFHF
jgi:hypothetical protein